jgi:HEAT repeat protein
MDIRPGDTKELPRLVALLSDKRELVRNAAASKLAQFRQAARPAEKKLEELKNEDPSQLVRESAAGALRSLRSRGGD